MRWYAILFIGLISLNSVWGQDDFYQPYPSCPQFKVQFIPQVAPLSGFKLLVPKNLDPLEWEDTQMTLARQSDLLSVDWIISQKVQKFCGRLPEDCDMKVDLPIDEKFFTDIKSLLQKIPPASNECDELAEVFVLQKEIENLKRDDIFTYKKQIRLRNIFKFFSPENSKTIDLFNKCGGKKGSAQFIKNSILINLANSCMIPKPPGSFTWEEAEKMATEISKDYGNTSLLKIKNVEEEITQKTMRTVARQMIAQQVRDYVPDVNAFVDELPFWKELETKIKNKDYRDTLMSLDATFEVVDHLLPYVIESQFKDKVSQVDPTVIAEVQERAKRGYEKCVKPYKEKMKIGASTEKRVKNYKELKETLSKKIHTSNNPCLSMPMLSETVGISDSEVLTSCVYSSITQGLVPIVRATLRQNLITAKDKTNPERLKFLNDKSTVITDHGIILLNQCLDRKFPGPFNSFLGTQSLNFVTPEASPFDIALLSCVDEMTLDIGRETSSFFVEDNIKNYFQVKSKSVATDILRDSFDPCIEALKKDADAKKSTSVDPSRCEYLITVRTTEKILEAKLKADYPDNKNDIEKIIHDLKICDQQGIDKFYEGIPSYVNSGGSLYTQQNIELRSCVAQAIQDISGVIAVNTFTNRVNELAMKGDLKFKKDILKQTPAVEKAIEDCFKKEFRPFKDWGAFSGLMQDSKSFDDVVHTCENQTTAASIANIFNFESKGQVKKYELQDLFPPKVSNDTVLNEVGGLIVQKSKLSVPKDLQGDDRRVWIFEQGYLAYLQTHPKIPDPIKGYTDFIAKLTEDISYKKVHQNLILKMTKLNSQEASDFKANADAACFERLNKAFFSQLPGPKKSGESSNPLDSLASKLIKGLDYFKKIDSNLYSIKLKEIHSVCQKSSLGYDDVNNSIMTEMILKGQIFDGLETDFSQVLLKGILAEKKKVKDPFKDIKLRYIDYKYNKIESLINTKLRNPKELDKILYADGTLLKFGQSSFAQLASGDKDLKTKFSQRMLKELFQDSQTGGFADQFAKYQLVASVGREGIEAAVQGAKDSWFSYLSNSPVNSAKQFFSNPANIESVVAWDRMNENMKKRFQSKIFLFGVLPQTDSEPFNTEIVEAKIFKTYYPAYHTAHSASLLEGIAESKLQTLVKLGSDHVLNRYDSDLNGFSLTTESTEKYQKMKLFSETEAENLITKDFSLISGDDRLQLKSYLVSQILGGVVAKDGAGLVEASGVESKISNGITNLVKKGISHTIDESLKRIEPGPKY